MWLRADRQTGGRGRQGRAWVSPPGNLHASTLVRSRAGDPAAATLAFVAAVALDEAVGGFRASVRPSLKWPNDLLLDGVKLAGILLERHGDAVVAGFGVNLAHAPEGLDRTATSLAAAGIAVPGPAAFLQSLAPLFARWLGVWRGEGFAPVRERWLARAHPRGTPLAVALPSGARCEGAFDGLAPDGALLLRLANGAMRAIHAADVFLI